MNGLTAPHRRVGFFIDSTTPIDLNATGWGLFDAAVDWAINGGSSTYMPNPRQATAAAGGAFKGNRMGKRGASAKIQAISGSIQRISLSFAGGPVAVQVSGDPDPANNGLFHIYADHLGSSGSLSDSSGVYIPNSHAKYTPFGDWRTEPTATAGDHYYTNHKHNNLGGGADDLGLIYMNARFYLPGVGRFASADSIVPDGTNPQSYNRYGYVLNNPIRYTDSSGHCIDGLSTIFCVFAGGLLTSYLVVEASVNGDLGLMNPLNYPTITEIHGQRVKSPTSSDVTGWLAEQMVSTATSQTVADMAALWSGGNKIDQMGVLAAWTAMVRTGGVWDFKPDIISAGITFDDLITIGSHDLNFQVVANIFFGFMGRQIGMGEELLQFGAGVAQSEHGWKHWLGNLQDYPGGYGDQQFDAWAISFGFYLHGLYGDDLSNLTEENLAQALDDYVVDNPIPTGP